MSPQEVYHKRSNPADKRSSAVHNRSNPADKRSSAVHKCSNPFEDPLAFYCGAYKV